jgi:hypothetical protein
VNITYSTGSEVGVSSEGVGTACTLAMTGAGAAAGGWPVES